MRIAIDAIVAPIGLPVDKHDDWEAVPDRFLPALDAAKRFIGQTAKYRVEGQVAFLHRGKVYATNNQVVLEFDLGPNSLADAALTTKDIATPIALGPPSEMRATPDVTEFRWADGSTFLLVHADQTDPVRYAQRKPSKSMDVPSPSEVAATVETPWVEPSFDVTDEWRQTIPAVLGRPGIEVIHFKKTYATAEVRDDYSRAATIGVDLGSGVPEISVSCRDLVDVLKFADALGFSDGSPRRVSFRFAGGRGVVAGQAANERGPWERTVDGTL
jgi:hypothetical protein